MSSEVLCKLAYDLGYRPTDRKLTPDAFEWMFVQNEACTGLLHWICNNVSPSNILSDSEVLEYASLSKNGSILTGKQLSDAVEDLAAISSLDEEEALEKEIAELEAELNPLKKHAQMLSRQQTRLESELAVSRQQNSKYERLLASRRDAFSKSMHPRINLRASQLDRLSASLDSSATQIVEILSSAVSNAGASQPSPFIATSAWGEYHDNEDNYAKQVRLFMKRMLQTSDADSPPPFRDTTTSGLHNGDHRSLLLQEGEEKTRYDWLYVADPKQVQFRGVDGETHARHSNELKRLRELFAPSELARTQAEMDLARKNAEIETLKLQAHQTPAHLDDLTYKQKARELQKKHQKVKALLARNLEIVLPELYAELAKLQSTPILWADYNLKLSRLHLQRVKIDLVIASLMKQRSKAILISHLLEDEKKQQILLYTLMNTISNDTAQIARNWNARSKILENRVAKPPNPPQLAHFSLISQLLDAGLHFNGPRFHKMLKRVSNQRKMETTTQRETNELDKLKRHVKELYKVLYAQSTGKQPISTPPDVAERCRRLETSTGTLAASMESIMKEFTGKSKLIADLPKELQFERRLWTLFFAGRSTTIKTAFDDLQAKVKALRTVAQV